MATITISPKWRYQISIKNSFEDETTPELVVELTNSLITQLEALKSKLETDRFVVEDEKNHFGNKLFEMIDGFEFLRSLANGSISECEWPDYDFDGDFEEEFNSKLSELYDIGDERVLLTGNIYEKFLWID